MKFNYKPEEFPITPTSKRAKVVWRPIIPVILIRGWRLVGYEALIDSGADYNIFHGDLAEIIGIKLTKGKSRKIYSLSGEPIKGYMHTVDIKPLGMRAFRVPVIFSRQMTKHSLGVLGNEGFFDHFKVEFDFKKKLININ